MIFPYTWKPVSSPFQQHFFPKDKISQKLAKNVKIRKHVQESERNEWVYSSNARHICKTICTFLMWAKQIDSVFHRLAVRKGCNRETLFTSFWREFNLLQIFEDCITHAHVLASLEPLHLTNACTQMKTSMQSASFSLITDHFLLTFNLSQRGSHLI